MKKRHLILYSFIFAMLVAITSEIVTYQLTGNHLLNAQNITNVKQPGSAACSTKPAPSIAPSTDPQLKILPDYIQACNSGFISDVMLFTNMPVSAPDAQKLADAMSVRLKAFAAQNITPVVVVEPDSAWGLIDFKEYASGLYDDANKAFFDRLKANGITEESLGIWMPFPEPQQTFWNNNANPDDYAANINRYFTIVRAHYPHAKTAILLDSQVSGTGTASQLLAYTRLIDPTLVSIAGLQGFPWYPSESGDKRQPIVSADKFAPASLLKEVAKSLNTKDVFLNTGTFRHKLTQNGGEVALSNEQREQSLDSIVGQAKDLRHNGYNVTVNIFAENKITTKEGTDWSYWEPGNYKKSAGTALFTRFVRALTNSSVSISLYDSRN